MNDLLTAMAIITPIAIPLTEAIKRAIPHDVDRWAPLISMASAVAFGASELADFAVYTPLRKRHWLGAVTLSNTVGLVVDSALFLWLAFGSLDYITGQIVGKAYMTALAVGVLWIVRNHLSVGPRQSQVAA